MSGDFGMHTLDCRQVWLDVLESGNALAYDEPPEGITTVPAWECPPHCPDRLEYERREREGRAA